MVQHRVIFHTTAGPLETEAAAMVVGMSVNQLVRAILENKDGRFDSILVKKGADKDE